MLKKWIMTCIIICLLLNSLSPVYALEMENSNQYKGCIVGIEIPENIELGFKPSMKEILTYMPTTLEASLSNGKVVELSVAWSCVGDYETTDYYYYQFDAVLKEEGYSLASNIELPYIVVSFMTENCFSVTGRSNETIIYNWLKTTMGCNTAVACGILANLERESGFNPTASCIDTNGKTSYGICQWNGVRFTALQDYCNGKGLRYDSLDGQLSYLQYELLTSEKRAWSYMQGIANSLTGAYQAGYNWAKYFERCASKYYGVSANRAQSKYWPEYGIEDGSTIPKFEGYIDDAEGGPGTVHVRGWAMDMNDMSESIEVHVYIGGAAELSGQPGVEAFVVPANQERVDVGNAYPGAGNYHGYSVTLNTSLIGKQSVHVYAYNPKTSMTAYVGITTVNIAAKVIPESISLDKTNVTLTSIGQTEQLTATISPDTATDKSVTWTSSNEKVATVDSTGLVTAVGDGTATITATTVDGNKTATCTVTVKTKKELVIQTQPSNKYVKTDDYATFTVEADGESLTYQWQFSKDNGKSWTNSGMSGAKTASLTVQGTEARNGQKYRCVITDKYGAKVTSNAVTLYVLGIKTQPLNTNVEEDDFAKFSVKAYGDGLKYQWQYKAANATEWKNSGMTGAKTASLTVVGTVARNGQQYRCVVTDGAGNKVTSKAATLTVKPAAVALAIVTNPSNKTVEEGESTVFKIAAQGEGLKYQWQFSKDNGKTWGNSGMTGAKTASLTVVGTAARNGQQYRCVVTDGAGNKVTSKAATLTVKSATVTLAIVTNPSNQTVKAGATATFTVAAQGEGLSYQWQFKAANGTEWKNSGMAGAKTASLSVVGTTARNGQQYRCVITDANGKVVTSNAASLVVTD